MTRIGKIFVMINLVLSMLFLAAAFGVYANGLNWATRQPDGGQKAVGIVDELKDKINNEQAPARDRAQDRWNKATTALMTYEAMRPRTRCGTTRSSPCCATASTRAAAPSTRRSRNSTATPTDC